MKRFIIIMVCCALLSGCAATQMLKPEQPPKLEAKKDKALLVILRDTYFGGAIVFWNYLDDQFIGETKGNSYFVTDCFCFSLCLSVFYINSAYIQVCCALSSSSFKRIRASVHHQQFYCSCVLLFHEIEITISAILLFHQIEITISTN